MAGEVTLRSLVRDTWHKRILRCFQRCNSISLRPRAPMPSLLHDPQRFQGGETGLNALTYNKQKKTSAFLPRLVGSGLSPPLNSLSFIYYYAIPWPSCCVNTDKSKSPHKQVQPGAAPWTAARECDRSAEVTCPCPTPFSGSSPGHVSLGS